MIDFVNLRVNLTGSNLPDYVLIWVRWPRLWILTRMTKCDALPILVDCLLLRPDWCLLIYLYCADRNHVDLCETIWFLLLFSFEFAGFNRFLWIVFRRWNHVVFGCVMHCCNDISSQLVLTGSYNEEGWLGCNFLYHCLFLLALDCSFLALCHKSCFRLGLHFLSI